MTRGRLAVRSRAVLSVALLALMAACSPDAAAAPVARTALVGPIPPDVTEGVDPATLPRTPAEDACVPIVRPAGTMNLCWQAHREPNEADALQDYYVLRVFATFGGGTSPRWAAIRARLVGEPSNNVFETWPRGVIEGPCRGFPAEGHFGARDEETLCGRTTSSSTLGEWDQRVTWECAGCDGADQAERAVALRQWIAVRARTIPTWEIFGDLGG